ncbi:MAG: EAL domain-containing protein [Betaproteobacteria bacterium]|nr:EAL domain-containing protein [Betaproteobacteria bacterium]
MEALRRIGALGVELTIDDFGVAQSNLAYLRSLPLKKLKIDSSFVRDLGTQPDAAVIVQTVSAMAHGLGLEVAAEGVENAAQLERLAGMGCREWQGHLYSAPLEAREFERLFAPGRGEHAQVS